MKVFSFLVATTVGLGCLIGTSATAHADDHSGSCLVINNRTLDMITVHLQIPRLPDDMNSLFDWTFSPWERQVVSLNGDLIKAGESGNFSIRVEDPHPIDWIYRADRNTSLGCNGSWVATIYPND
ncbi:hypothetical protein ACFXHA_40940 [Nocardia sp. NPDC059240]|uniref:hypothetical protein n=1 Tax=Nocardia sp. NPDC059240 TaxID=3346786 RepID=UPI0036B8C0BE